MCWLRDQVKQVLFGQRPGSKYMENERRETQQVHMHTIRYNTYNTIQYDTIRYNTYRDRKAKWLLVTKLKASNTPALMRVLSESNGTNSDVTMQMPPLICGRVKEFERRQQESAGRVERTRTGNRLRQKTVGEHGGFRALQGRMNRVLARCALVYR